MTMKTNKKQEIVVKTKKSVLVSLILTFFFGPLGMLYSTVGGAIIMLIVSAVVGFITMGFGLFFTWPICMIWGAIAAARGNKQTVQL